MLTDEQKAGRVLVVNSLSDDFIGKVNVSCIDETWITLYETETKSSMRKTPGSPSPNKFKVGPSAKKHMFIIFFDVDGVILRHGSNGDGEVLL